MTSTYLLYQSYASNLPQSLQRIAAEPDVSTAAAYYKDNIGKITSVDDFLNNSRVFSYAMKAYGLEDMTYAKAFMRKVLESDLSDQSSFVNKLTDPRFLTFAKAFQFSTDGSITAQPVVAQSTIEEDNTIGLYSQQQVTKGAAAGDDASYYQAEIGSVKNVEDLLSNSRLLNYAETAYGLDPSIMSNATIKAVLTSDLSDPSSEANTLPNPAYKALAAAFNFASDGTAINGSAQTAANVGNTVYQYFTATGTDETPAAESFKAQYYQANISSVTSVDDLLNNNNLLDIALTAVGLDPATQSKTTLRSVLTSDLSDSSSVANQQGGAYLKLAQAFNFNTDGSINGDSAQTFSQTSSMLGLYASDYNATQTSANATESAYYQQEIGSIASVDDLVANTRLYDYVLSAYGLDPSTTSKLTVEQALESDATDPMSFVNSTHNSSLVALSKAFNFDADGNSKTVSTAITNNSLLSTLQLYDAQSPDGTGTDAQTQADNTYFSENIGKVQTVDDLLGDPKLVNYIVDAYGLQKDNLSNDELRTILTSDPLDPKSFVNQPQNSSYRALAVAFNFGTDGKTLNVPATEAQDRGQVVATSDLYLRQTMEEDAGDQNEGVRLALYFQRNAPNITSAYSILADSALLQVTETALGLPSAISQEDIDSQASLITSKLNISDLQDPTKLNKFLARFAALYDVQNSDAAATSPAVMLLSGGTDTSDITTIAAGMPTVG